MAVTGADPARRIVRSINDEPAAPEYARLLGKDPAQLSPFTFAAHPVEQYQQRVPEAVDIGKHDRLGVPAELRPGELLDELFKRAEPAGERHEGVRLDEHQRLPLMHVVDDDELLSLDQHVLALAQEAGNDAGDVAASVPLSGLASSQP